jgi:hypothetical protein
LTDHNVSVYNVVGRVTDSQLVEESGEVYFEGEVYDDKLIERIANGLVKYVSISVDPEKTICSTCGKISRSKADGDRLIHLCSGAHEIVVNPHPLEVSFVVFPAYRDTLIQPIGFASAMNYYLAKEEEKSEREKLRDKAKEREKKYGIKFDEGRGHLTPPKDYPEDEKDYADPVNYAYPLVPEERCRNALARWSQFRDTYEQKERNIIYERIVRRALDYGIEVKYNPDLPECKNLPENIKKKMKGYESEKKEAMRGSESNLTSRSLVDVEVAKEKNVKNVRTSENITSLRGERERMSKEAQVETTIPTVQPPEKTKGELPKIDEVYNILVDIKKMLAEMEARRKAEEEAKKKFAEEEAKKRAEEEAKKKAEEEARKKALEEAEEAIKKKAEEGEEEGKEMPPEETKKSGRGIVYAPISKTEFPDWFLDLLTASRNLRGIRK